MSNMKMTTFFLDLDAKAQLRIEAARRGISMSDFLRQIVAQELAKSSFFADGAHRNTQNAKSDMRGAASEAR